MGGKDEGRKKKRWMEEKTLAGTEKRLDKTGNKELAPVAELPCAADTRAMQKEPSNKLKLSWRQVVGGGGGGDISASAQSCEKVLSGYIWTIR